MTNCQVILAVNHALCCRICFLSIIFTDLEQLGSIVVLSVLRDHSDAATTVPYQKQKGQFKMIMKRLLSYGDGKCGVWYALARKSLDVTRGV